MEEIKNAINSALADSFYTGDNDRDTRYDYPETVLKNDDAVDRHLDRLETGRTVEEDKTVERLEKNAELTWSRLLAMLRKGYDPELDAGESEAYLAVKGELEEALAEGHELRPLRSRFAAAYVRYHREREPPRQEA